VNKKREETVVETTHKLNKVSAFVIETKWSYALCVRRAHAKLIKAV